VSSRWSRFAAIYAVFAILIGLGYLANTAEAYKLAPEYYTGQEVGTQPGFYESYDEAMAYWSAVPGVKSLTDACGPPPQMFSVIHAPHVFNGYAMARDDSDPCRIWVEEIYIAETDAMPDWQRDQDRCRLVVHEVGHTLGLDHLDYGDQAHVMVPGATIPQVCQTAYPAPANPQPTEWSRTVCLPGWAYYSTDKVLKTYMVKGAKAARKVFKRWAKAHRRAARDIDSYEVECVVDGFG
jgi:hypothetical protein